MLRSVGTCLGVGIAAIFIAGCQSMTYTIDPAKGTMLGKPSTASVGSVHESATAHFMFWGLLPVSRPDLNEIAFRNAGPNRVLADITIREENDFLDGVAAAVTLGLWRPRTIDIYGELYNKEGLTYAK